MSVMLCVGVFMCGFCNVCEWVYVWDFYSLGVNVCVGGFCNVCVCVRYLGFVMCGCVRYACFVRCGCVYVWVLQCAGV